MTSFVFTLVSNFYKINSKFFIKSLNFFIFFLIISFFFFLKNQENFFFVITNLNLLDFFFYKIINIFLTLCYFFLNSPLNFFNFYFNYLDYPIFIWSGCFFLFSSLFSLFFLNYLGFYGIFVLNWLTLFFFWSSCLPYVSYILEENGYYYINIGKWMNISSNYFFLLSLKKKKSW